MSYEYKENHTPIKQTSLAGGSDNRQETVQQSGKAEMLKKYRRLSIILIGVIIVAVIILLAKMGSAPTAQVVITADNWSEYFVISTEIMDTSIIYDSASLYSMQTNYSIRLKDYYVERLDKKQASRVSFSLSYLECMGLFDMDYKNLRYTVPDNFSTAENCTATVALTLPQSVSGLIHSTTILGGEGPDERGLGLIGCEFIVTSANGTLYLKAG